jgi:hypothetical protein
VYAKLTTAEGRYPVLHPMAWMVSLPPIGICPVDPSMTVPVVHVGGRSGAIV